MSLFSTFETSTVVAGYCSSFVHRNKDIVTNERLSGARVLVIAGSQEKYTMPEVYLLTYLLK